MGKKASRIVTLIFAQALIIQYTGKAEMDTYGSLINAYPL